MTDDHALRQALAYARRGWPVFPCQPGKKIPATPHGYLDATTDPGQIPRWFARHPDWNLAVATGAPGPDVLDIDKHGQAGDGFAALARLRRAGLLDGAAGLRPHPQRRPAPLLHRHQPSAAATCPPATSTSCPPAATSWPRPPRSAATPTSSCGDHRPATAPWTGPAVSALLHLRAAAPAGPEPARPRTGPGHLARWVAAQREGNRNAGLFWAANRALEATRPPTSARSPPPPARPASPTRRSPGPSTPPAAPPRPAPNHPATRPRR